MNKPIDTATDKPFSSRIAITSDWLVFRHFVPQEFRHPENMGIEFLYWLDEFRNRIAMPIILTSDSRTLSENVNAGGARDSAHCDIPCNAVDIGERPRPDDPNWNRTRYAIVTTALAMGCTRIGLYANGSVHLDLTDYYRPGGRIWRVVR